MIKRVSVFFSIMVCCGISVFAGKAESRSGRRAFLEGKQRRIVRWAARLRQDGARALAVRPRNAGDRAVVGPRVVMPRQDEAEANQMRAWAARLRGDRAVAAAASSKAKNQQTET